MFVYSPTKQSAGPPSPARRDDLRAHNSALLLRTLWAAPEGAARTDLAAQTGLSRATVSNIVGELLAGELVVEGARRASRGGRPARVLRFHDVSRCLLGIELGASHVSSVCTDLRGRVLGSERQEHDVQGDPVGTLECIGAQIDRLRAAAPAPVIGLGMAVPSPILADNPGRLSADLFPGWAEIDLAVWLRSRTGLPVMLDNDANLGALAEHWWGEGRGRTDFAYIKVATGVGAGVIINGDIYRGAGGIAGEIGHTAIDPNGPQCRCGLAGCLESLVGTQSLLERAAEAARQEAETPAWARPAPTLSALIEAARSGDPVATRLISRTGHWLGIAIANLLNLINPSCIVLGGRLTRAGDLLLTPLRAAMAERALWSSVAETRVTVSSLPGEPIALGAATLLLQGLLSRPDALLNDDVPGALATIRPQLA
jgi:predicted NBD/HSP70 family sugar kinase